MDDFAQTAGMEIYDAGGSLAVRAQRTEEALAGSTMISDPQTYSRGDVGWFADQGKFVLASGTEIPIRITGVYEKEAGKWKLVQWHGSVGIPNTDVGFGDI